MLCINHVYYSFFDIKLCNINDFMCNHIFFIQQQSVFGFPSKNKEGERNFDQMGVVKNRPDYEYVFLP